MSDKKHPQEPSQSQGSFQLPQIKMFPASEIGVSLKISDKALEKIKRHQEESIKAARKARDFIWG